MELLVELPVELLVELPVELELLVVVWLSWLDPEEGKEQLV